MLLKTKDAVLYLIAVISNNGTESVHTENAHRFFTVAGGVCDIAESEFPTQGGDKGSRRGRVFTCCGVACAPSCGSGSLRFLCEVWLKFVGETFPVVGMYGVNV